MGFDVYTFRSGRWQQRFPQREKLKDGGRKEGSDQGWSRQRRKGEDGSQGRERRGEFHAVSCRCRAGPTWAMKVHMMDSAGHAHHSAASLLHSLIFSCLFLLNKRLQEVHPVTCNPNSYLSSTCVTEDLQFQSKSLLYLLESEQIMQSWRKKKKKDHCQITVIINQWTTQKNMWYHWFTIVKYIMACEVLGILMWTECLHHFV